MLNYSYIMPELVKGELQKGLEYTEKLLTYDQPTTFTEKIVSKFSNKKSGPHNKTKWCKILGSSDKNPQTREYLNYLEKNGALVEEYSEGKTKYYSLNKKNLLKAAQKSSWWSQRRDLVFQIINKAESNRKVVTDF